MKGTAALLTLAFAAAAAAAARPATAPGPLARDYKEGERLVFRIEGTHTMGTEVTRYRARASGTVRRDSSGVFFEEFRWTDPDHRHPASSPIQKLSLDPAFRLSIPDLSKVEPGLIGPITDLMTFYADDQLAIRRRLTVAGAHQYVAYGAPSSWADGRRVVVGYDCIDFDATLQSVDATEHLALLRVRHLPPPGGCARANPPAAWMRERLGHAPNNWFQVTRNGDGSYEAAAGKETFDALIRIGLPSGAIQSATLDNPVEFRSRRCKDADLKDCGPARRARISRAIVLSLEERP